MTADNGSLNVGQRTSQSLTQIVFEAGAVQRATHADYAVFRQTSSFQGQISHGVHRIADDNQDGIRRMLENVFSNRFNDTGVGADQFFTGHAGFTRQTGSDDNHCGTGCFCIIISASYYTGVKAKQRRGLHHVHGFAFGNAFFDIKEYHFAGNLANSQNVCACCAYIACTDDCNFHLICTLLLIVRLLIKINVPKVNFNKTT